MSVWVIDIETVPLGTKLDRPNGMPDKWMELEPFQAPLPKQVPVSYRDPAKIAAKQAQLEKRNADATQAARHKWASDRLSAWKARALSPYTAEVVAIAMHPLDDYLPDEPGSVHTTFSRIGPRTEAGMLQQLELMVARHNVTHLVHWGSYDPPVLREALCRHDLKLPTLEHILRRKMRGRVWYPNCLDASVLTHARQMTYNRGWGLKAIAAQLKWADNASVQSAAVYDAWLAKNYAACVNRAACDVQLVLAILERERCVDDVMEWAGVH